MTLQRYEFILKQQIKVWRIITTKSFNISYPLPFPTFHDRSPCRVPPGRLTMSGQPPHCASGLYGVTEVASLRDAPLLRGLSPHCASGLYGVIEVASLRDAPLLRALSPHCAFGLYGVTEVASLRDALLPTWQVLSFYRFLTEGWLDIFSFTETKHNQYPADHL